MAVAKAATSMAVPLQVGLQTSNIAFVRCTSLAGRSRDSASRLQGVCAADCATQPLQAAAMGTRPARRKRIMAMRTLTTRDCGT